MDVTELKNYRVVFYTASEEFSVNVSAKDEQEVILELDDMINDAGSFLKANDGMCYRMSNVTKLKIEELEETK